MSRSIVIIQGHPDPAGNHFCHALADAYAAGARKAGHRVESIPVAALEFPILRTKAEFESATVLPAIQRCQDMIRTADHLLILYPLWLGTMPAF